MQVLLVERGFKAALQGASEDSLEVTSWPRLCAGYVCHTTCIYLKSHVQGGDHQSDAPNCSSCGITLNQAELEHTEQHEGRCGNCQKLYENKNYCPVCNKVSLATYI